MAQCGLSARNLECSIHSARAKKQLSGYALYVQLPMTCISCLISDTYPSRPSLCAFFKKFLTGVDGIDQEPWLLRPDAIDSFAGCRGILAGKDHVHFRTQV